ncbi:MAG: hypothetical protein ACI8RD_008043 [Bacillariaceae sp.]|jgi:hypothetical protein
MMNCGIRDKDNKTRSYPSLFLSIVVVCVCVDIRAVYLCVQLE